MPPSPALRPSAPKPKSFDKKAALKIKGVKHVASLETGVAVCATSLDVAWKGRDALKVQWSEGTRPKMDNDSLKKDFHEHMKKSGVSALDKGDADKALSAAKKTVEASYLVPYLCHVTMEPMNCTASVSRDRCEIWVPTQNQSGVLKMARKITGLKAEQIRVHTTFLGGGFGRRFELDMVEPTLKLAKETGKPVKWIYKREEDTRYDFYRPSSLCHITGGLDDSGNIVGWKHKIVCPSIWARVNPGRMEGGVDPSAVEGVVNTPYEIPSMQVEYVRIDLPIPVGFWRSVGNSINGFTMESFMDEMAHAAGKDPLAVPPQSSQKPPPPQKAPGDGGRQGRMGQEPSRGAGPWESPSTSPSTPTSRRWRRFRWTSPPARSRCIASSPASTAAGWSIRPSSRPRCAAGPSSV